MNNFQLNDFADLSQNYALMCKLNLGLTGDFLIRFVTAFDNAVLDSLSNSWPWFSEPSGKPKSEWKQSYLGICGSKILLKFYIYKINLRPGAARPTAVQGASPRLRRVREQKNRFAVFLRNRRMAAAQGAGNTANNISILSYFSLKNITIWFKKVNFWGQFNSILFFFFIDHVRVRVNTHNFFYEEKN